MKANKEDWDLEGVMTATEASRSGFQRKFCEMLADCLAVRTEVLASLVDVGRKATKEKRTGVAEDPCELQVTSDAVLELQHLSLSRVEESRLCRQQLEGVEKQLDLARKRVACVEAVSAEAAFVPRKSWHIRRRNAT